MKGKECSFGDHLELNDESHVAVAGRKLDTLVVVLERVEDVAEELFRNATDVVQVDLLQLTVVLLQFLQHLDDNTFIMIVTEHNGQDDVEFPLKGMTKLNSKAITSSGFTSFGGSGSKYWSGSAYASITKSCSSKSYDLIK